MTKPTLAEYEALGIHEDTMACVAIVSKREAKEAVWVLASNERSRLLLPVGGRERAHLPWCTRWPASDRDR